MKDLMRLAISTLEYSNRVSIVVISKWEPGNYTGSIPLYLPTQVSKLLYPTETYILINSGVKRVPKRLPGKWVTTECRQR